MILPKTPSDRYQPVYGYLSSWAPRLSKLSEPILTSRKRRPLFPSQDSSKLKYQSIGSNRIPTWTTPLILLVFVTALVPNTSFLGHLCSVGIGYACQCQPHPAHLHNAGRLFVNDADHSIDGLGYLKILAPPEKVLRWIEGKLNLLGRLPHYVSMDQKTYGRYGVLPSTNPPPPSTSNDESVPMSYLGSSQRLGP